MTKKASSNIALIIHAGAGSHPKDWARLRRIEKKLGEILEDGYRFLKNHSAVDTVMEVVRWLEDWPETNAGRGSMLQADGQARLSASLMDGHLMRFSGVINIERIKNPILIAEALQNERDRLLASDGALRFAMEKGFRLQDLRTKASLKRWRRLRTNPLTPPSPPEGGKDKGEGETNRFGTVGACALDFKGHLVAATSTGGKGMERAGRVSDSGLPAGNYANSFAAVSATGLGEDIVEEALASTLAMRAADLKNIERAFRNTFMEAQARGRRFAAIGVDRNGKVFWSRTTEILYFAFRTPLNQSKGAKLFDHDLNYFPSAPKEYCRDERNDDR